MIHPTDFDRSSDAAHPKIPHDRFILAKLQELKRPLLDELLNFFLKNYLAWAGHAARLPEDRPLKQQIFFRDVAWFRSEQKNP